MINWQVQLMGAIMLSLLFQKVKLFIDISVLLFRSTFKKKKAAVVFKADGEERRHRDRLKFSDLSHLLAIGVERTLCAGEVDHIGI